MGDLALPGAPDRHTVEAWLDQIVRRHRVTLAVTVPAVGAVLLVAGARGVLPREVVFHPALLMIAVAAMRLPLIAGVLPVLDRRAVAGLGGLALFAYAVELVGVTTGMPYGPFRYTTDLGPTLGGLVPLALPLLYLPLVVDSYLLGLLLLGPRGERRRYRVLVGVCVLVVVDLVLDPGAVAVGFWTYAANGGYYGVPATNFGGWFLTGAVAIGVVDLTLDRHALRARAVAVPYLLDDLVNFLVLWGGVNLAVGQWVPVLVALILAAAVGSQVGVIGRLGLLVMGGRSTG